MRTIVIDLEKRNGALALGLLGLGWVLVCAQLSYHHSVAS